MRKSEATKFHNTTQKLRDFTEDYGVNLAVSSSELLSGGLKELNLKELKSWFLNVGAIALFIDETLFKMANTIVCSNDIKTLNKGSIPRSFIPKVIKVTLSKKDKEALYQLHCKIREITNKIRLSINLNYDDTANCSVYNMSTLSTNAMIIAHDLDDITGY